MQDQVKYLKSIGLAAEFIGNDQNDEEAKKAVERATARSFSAHPSHFCSGIEGGKCFWAKPMKRGCALLL